MKSFLLPDLGEGLAESEIIEWHVSEGDYVEVDQTVLTVETAKAVVEVPAPYSGIVVRRHGNEGDVVNIGALLLEIKEQGAMAEPQTVSETTSADAATVVGNVSQQAHSVDVDDFWVGADSNHHEQSSITAMPSARLLANKLGVNLEKVEGTGLHGLITDDDIYHEAGRQQPGTEVLKGARRTMVSTMTESHHNVASVTITEEASLANWPSKEDISARLIQAVVYACQKEPALNAWFDADTMTRCVHSTVNIGIAVDSAHGLYVPVLRHADKFDDEGIRVWLDQTVQGIRERKIGREQLQHATITLSNFGAIAGIYATPVVSPPQVAIVGAGRIIDKLTLVDGQAVMTKAMPLSITFDHRACTGGEAARFTKKLVEHLEK
ncbi:branched-chain alpha-keto acid dehydrogenase subunit E2 [Vibrio sinaloensis DSM 21326]|uniref:Dihydrolipoamide acetyltransferase component of pyruvate dehydrogenase complex n=1 Tax=Vibrio sinaloensis DSM 21326 TaxID=945550 RepID=E8MB22_PHOS4|nr:dihydrolipoamide acetyltransferase family protein [Vibrio sinaloensis]EGA68852.1 branched-chain alpha-keto acid dehydrogenase subunit E2 [Vibrio sinaloensis DSM 21326]